MKNENKKIYTVVLSRIYEIDESEVLTRAELIQNPDKEEQEQNEQEKEYQAEVIARYLFDQDMEIGAINSASDCFSAVVSTHIVKPVTI